MPKRLSFRLQGSDLPIDLVPEIVAIAGYTGRDQEAVRRHVEELAAQGIAPPPHTPMIYPITSDRVVVGDITQDLAIEVVGEQTSGEAEFVLVIVEGEIYVAVGSDHTDRELEKVDIPAAKQVCPQVVGAELWRLADLDDHWDRLRLRSWAGAEREPYQDGGVDALMRPRDILALVQARCTLPVRQAIISCGTVPLLGEGFKGGSRFEAELVDPVLDRRLSLTYTINPVRWLRNQC